MGCLRVMTSHTASVTCLKWGGASLLYSASQDRTIKVWRASDGALCRTLQGHGHWVNVLALNTDYVMRTGAFDPKDAKVVADDSLLPAEEAKANAETRYNAVMKVVGEEMLVSGSDDFTLFLWKPGSEKTPIARMTGHQQLVNDVKFSPDARLVASASFDKSIRVWCGKTGRFLDPARPRSGCVSGFLGCRQPTLSIGLGRLDPQAVVDGDKEAAHGFARARRRGVHRGLESRWAEGCVWEQRPPAQNMAEMSS